MKNLVASLLILGITSGCMTVEKAEKVMRAHPKELAELCLDCFGDKKEPVYIKGDIITEIKRDTIQGDSIPYPVEVDCPDGTTVKKEIKVQTKYVTIENLRVDTNYRDTWQTLAKLKILEVDNINLIKERDEAIKSSDGWRKSCLWGWGIIGGYLLIVFIKKRLP